MLPDLSNAVWRKSSRSGGEGGNCVELTTVGAVRDSKNPTQAIRANVWTLIDAVKAGDFSR